VTGVAQASLLPSQPTSPARYRLPCSDVSVILPYMDICAIIRFGVTCQAAPTQLTLLNASPSFPLPRAGQAARLGSGAKDAGEIKSHAFFKPMNWDRLANLEIEPPLKPGADDQNPSNPVNFDDFYTNEAAVDSPHEGVSPCESYVSDY
jgi:hypothetical protein